MIDEERRDGRTKTWYSRNTLLALTHLAKWAYYADQMREARSQWRISNVPPWACTQSSYSLGFGYQRHDNDMVLSDILKGSANHRLLRNVRRKSLSLCRYVLNGKPYNYWTHYLPHDGSERTQTGQSQSRFSILLGWRTLEVVPRLPIEDGIDAVRRMFKSVWIDENNCERGINALTSYHKDYDKRTKRIEDNQSTIGHRMERTHSDIYESSTTVSQNKRLRQSLMKQTTIILLNL